MTDDKPERIILRPGDVIARKFLWSREPLHVTVDAEQLATWQAGVDSQEWKLVRKAGTNG
jgi:hypothetical protein